MRVVRWLRHLLKIGYTPFSLNAAGNLDKLSITVLFGLAMLVLLCVGISNTFLHVIWHAEGPLLPDPGMTQTALGKSLHLVLFFIIGGVVGIMCRRDHVAGIDDMLDSLMHA